MGILSYFGKQTFTLYLLNNSGIFKNMYDPDSWFRLDYQTMRIHMNKFECNFEKDYIEGPHEKKIKTDINYFLLRDIAIQFNDEQEKELYRRVHLEIDYDDISYNSDTPFPVEFGNDPIAEQFYGYGTKPEWT
ncbi:hypothetical protein [Flavobacterium weaverense]|uniref:Uncharacterized protein n=1 Tax=Flavobacterium weaverense TaxID=271156 RepID=A0A3L9ZZ04_9FLAO|nr:hypothetical protein [Flavobacterium weaverense]RMA77953.1 hypothetical protein BC961_0313 [Flavobacterium weaverense]